jgi:hypothetical protein
MEAYIISKINTLIRECNIKCDFMQSGSHIIKFEYSSEYSSVEQIQEFISDKMMEVILMLEDQAGKHYEFGYEVDNECDEWEISIEWTSKVSNPFDNVSLDD